MSETQFVRLASHGICALSHRHRKAQTLQPTLVINRKKLMKCNLTLNSASLACLVLIAAPTVNAQDAFGYGGLSWGQTRAHLDEARIAQEQITSAVTVTNITRDSSSEAYKLFGGYQFSRNFAMEAGYFNLGHFTMGANTVPVGNLQGRFSVQGVNMDLIGILPLGTSWAATARIGANFARTRDQFGSGGAVMVMDPSPSHRATNGRAGVGLQYEVSPSFLVRTDLERSRINDAVQHDVNVNMWSVSLVFPLGRTAATPQRAVQASSYVAPAPAPMEAAAAPATPVAVVVAPAPPPPAPMVAVKRRVSLSAESLFGFDQSTMRDDGKLALDGFAKALVGTQYDQILVEGHADRLGRAAYNQTLSEQRAESVKTYLVGTSGLDAGKVKATGLGESQPHTQKADCGPNLPKAALVACLQPDRRVEIEVTGSR